MVATLGKKEESETRLLYPYKMIGRFTDGTEKAVGGNDEEDCIYQLIEMQERHGELTWYSGCCDEYYENGERIY